jgi:hypothetical protein
MSDRSVLQKENHTDERIDAWMASHVRRGDLVHEAKEQSFRYRKDLGLPNQVCLFRRAILPLTMKRQQAAAVKATATLQWPKRGATHTKQRSVNGQEDTVCHLRCRRKADARQRQKWVEQRPSSVTRQSTNQRTPAIGQ